jgi:hypothetical protein
VAICEGDCGGWGGGGGGGGVKRVCVFQNERHSSNRRHLGIVCSNNASLD